MIRPDDGKLGPQDLQKGRTEEPSTKDFWAYVQDERLRHPKLWRLVIRIHTRAFHLAYPDLSLDNVWKLGAIILQDAVTAIQDQDGDKEELSRFRLQMPVFPVEGQTQEFEGRWRGWVSIGKPQLVY